MKILNFVSKYRSDLWAGVIYTVFSIILTYPVAFQLTSHIAGFPGEDNLQWRWFLWWFKYSLLNLQTSVSHVSILFAPTGGEQPLYAITSYVPALALPLTLLGGPTLSFNLSFLLSFALSGYTAYLLAYYLTRQRLAAFVGGLIFAFFPARFGHATGVFLGQLTTYFLPIYLLALLMLTHHPNWGRAIWAAIVLALLCLTWPLHVAYGVVIFTLPFIIWQAICWLRQPQKRLNLKYFGLTFGLALLLISSFYWPLFKTALSGAHAHLGDTTATQFSVDLLAFAAPSNYHPVLQPLGLLPDYVYHVLADRDDIQERLVYVGLVPVWLTIMSLVKFGRRLLFWLLIALAAVILSLGPLLKFNGSLVQFNIEGYVGYILLPYAILRSVPILDWSGVLGRINMAAMLCIAVMSAYGVKWLLQRIGSQEFLIKGLPLGLTTLLTLLILFEYLTIWPFPNQPDNVPGFYNKLQNASTPQAIIDLPLLGEPVYSNYAMHAQTVHHQPIVGGHFMREPAKAKEMTSFINRLLQPSPNQTVLAEPDLAARLGLLNHFKFSKIVARLPFMQDELAQTQLTYLSNWLGKPDSEGEVMVFSIPPGGTALKITPLLSGQGWQLGDNLAQLDLTAPADVLVYLDSSQPEVFMLHLTMAAPEADRYLQVRIDGRPALRLYLNHETLTYKVPLTLLPGAHQLTFFPQEACQKECSPVGLAHIAFASDALPSPVSFGNQLTLLKSDLSTTVLNPGQPLLVYLYWQSQNWLNENYSVFIHLMAPSGELIGQADYLLGGWLYPTSQWSQGFMTAVPTLLFLPSDIPSGQYQFRVGVYQPESGQRLLDDSGADSALLTTITILEK